MKERRSRYRTPDIFFGGELSRLNIISANVVRCRRSFSNKMFPRHPLRGARRNHYIMYPFFHAGSPANFVVRNTSRFRPFILSMDKSFPLITTRGPNTTGNLMVPSRNFILRRRIIGITVRRFFFELKGISSGGAYYFLRSTFLEMCIKQIRLDPDQ